MKKKLIKTKNGKTKKIKRKTHRRKNKNTNFFTKKCNQGLLGAQEDIFTLGQCKKYKYGGGSCNNNVTPINPYMSPNAGLANSIPGPMEGKAWTGDGLDGNRNFNSLNNYNSDIQLQIQNAGRRKSRFRGHRRTNKTIKRGGTGLVQSLSYHLGNLYNGFTGVPSPINPSPYKDQIPTLNMKNSVNY